MRKTKHVWKQITDLDNIKLAIGRASEKKRHRHIVQKVLSNLDFYALEIQRMLVEKTFVPTPYIPVTIRDGASQKTRLIHKPAFYPDQVVHWALVLPLQEGWRKSIYPYSCGSIPGRGLHSGATAMKRWLANDRKGTKYCYKIDIRKYYPSVDHEILYEKFARRIHDADALWLIRAVIDSHDQGLPIGNFTSQWFANLYLADFDWWVRQELGARYYQRYIDDIVVLHGNKRELHAMRRRIEEKLAREYRLDIKQNWQVFKTDSRGIDFLGYRFFHHKTILRKRTAYRLARRMRLISRKDMPSVRDASAVMSYMGITTHCDSRNFVQRYVVPFVSLFRMKEIHRENCAIVAGSSV